MSKKFYMTPGSCSTGIHILLEECGLVFEAHIVNLLAGDQYKPDYLAINPKGSIPALVLDDGTALTEFSAIAWWLARSYPKRQLLPATLAGEVRALGLMNYAVHTLHTQGFARIFTTERFAPSSGDHASVKAQGRQIIDQGFAIVDRELAGRDYVDAQFGIADAALFYVEFWAERIGIPLPENCLAHYRRLLTRPAVRQVLAEEGYASVLR
ncbi:glutathione S-transferase [Dechloromonas denitrificans]|uniref:Glutathione S-transferase n=1 Tax=Dechloromonas denitrificans TaxID=281362 RepID=A0A133XGD3_9RHOO|nr:glutathione S-transferase N-terminal domain-containing protein [Dechloromonas denitrificans]KXB29991.1 glutathione S-transferase [Dechloromonas denitrificans]